MIWWQGGQWKIRDLGSRNGTRLDGELLDDGEVMLLEVGASLQFGDYPLLWAVESIVEPTPMAQQVDGEGLVVSEDNIIALPDEHAPVAVIYGDERDGWQLESGDEVRTVADLDVVSVAGKAWRLFLPHSLPPTVERSEGPLHLADLTLEFEVSADEEHVSLVARAGATKLQLGSRAHHYALLLLARARLADAELSPNERGWIYVDELQAMLQLDREQLNMAVYRARKQLSAAGVLDARGLIERRTDTRQVRLGVARIELLGDE